MGVGTMTQKRNKFKQTLIVILTVFLVFLITLTALKLGDSFLNRKPVEEPNPPVVNEPQPDPTPEELQPDPVPEPEPKEPKRAKVMANGDILIHDLLYMSAYDAQTDSYDFNSQFEKIAPLLKSADLTIGNFEGSISDQFQYGGYPIFNAPKEIADAVKNAGYDVVSLANNHIVDSHGAGIDSTYHAFNDIGVNTIGVNMTAEQPILVKEVNGIRIAMLAYAYGFNGMEATLTQEEYDLKLEPIIESNIEADILAAEEIADITIVLPHMGVEYMMEPTQEQIDLYHKMIGWGADIVFGNHPHVVQPTEIVQKDGLDKFILYSMGNFLSNQRLETVSNIWTERGVLTEVNLVAQEDSPVMIESIVAHPTWVYKMPIEGKWVTNDLQAYQYHVLSTREVLAGQVDLNLDEDTLNRIQGAHDEVLEHLSISELTGGQ